METEAIAAVGATAAELDFSLMALFLRATLTVKIVMIMLILASFWSWAIIIDKLLNFRNWLLANVEVERLDLVIQRQADFAPASLSISK